MGRASRPGPRPEDLVVCLIPLWEQLGLASAWVDAQRWLRDPPVDAVAARRALRAAEARAGSFCDGLYRPLGALRDRGLAVPRGLMQRLELAAHGDWREVGLPDDHERTEDDVVELVASLLADIRRLQARIRRAAASHNPPPPRVATRPPDPPDRTIDGSLVWMDVYENTRHGLRLGDDAAWAQLRAELFERIWATRPDVEGVYYAFPDSGDLEVWFVEGGDADAVRRALLLAEHATLTATSFSRGRREQLGFDGGLSARLHLKCLVGSGRFRVVRGPDGNRIGGRLVNQLGQLEKQPFLMRPSSIVVTGTTLRRARLPPGDQGLARPYLETRASGRRFDLHLIQAPSGVLRPRGPRRLPRRPVEAVVRRGDASLRFRVHDEADDTLALSRSEPVAEPWPAQADVEVEFGDGRIAAGRLLWVAKEGRLLAVDLRRPS